MLDAAFEYLHTNFPDHTFKIGISKEHIHIPHWMKEEKRDFDREILEVEIDDNHTFTQIVKGMPKGIEDFSEEKVFENLHSITERHLKIMEKKKNDSGNS